MWKIYRCFLKVLFGNGIYWLEFSRMVIFNLREVGKSSLVVYLGIRGEYGFYLIVSNI